MALKGTLEEFPLADIFQLIGQQQKSGSLFIRNEGTEARIVFDEGKVLLGTFQGSHKELLLGAMLSQAGVITESQLSEILTLQKETKRSLGDLLIQRKWITTDIFKEFTSLQLDEVLFIIFSWEKGLYEFVQGKIKFNPNYLNQQRAEGVLMESFRRKDEWPAISKKIGPLSSIYQLGTTQNVDELNLEPNEKKLFKCLDGESTTKALCFKSRLGTFETGLALSKLIDKGFVKISKGKETTSTKTTLIHPRSMVSMFLVGTLIPMLIFSPISLWKTTRKNFLFQTQKAPLSMASFSILRMQNTKERLMKHIETYKFDNGFYPNTLEVLNLDSKYTRHWNYVPQEQTFLLSFKGDLK